MKITSYDNIHVIPDDSIEQELLPFFLVGNDNHNIINEYKIALETAVKNLLQGDEKKIIEMFFFEQLLQKDIAKKLKVSNSTVSKRKSAAMNKLQKNLECFDKTYKLIKQSRTNN